MAKQFKKMKKMITVSKRWSSEIFAAIFRTGLVFRQQKRELGTLFMRKLRTLNSPGFN